MKLTQFKRLLREEVRKVIKEVGDSSAQPYPINGLQAVIAKFKKQIQQGATRLFTGDAKNNINAGVITFQTEEGTKKSIYVGLNSNKKNKGLTMEVYVTNPEQFGSDDHKQFLSQEGTNLYKLMATITAACKNITDSIPEINELKFESYPDWSKEDVSDDTKALKFILSYVKQAYGSNISVKNNYGDVYVKLLDRIKNT